jgi:RNA polymerase sigma factor (sigma-70 family)
LGWAAPPPSASPESPAGARDWTAISQRLHRLALALARRSHDADDLTQATFAALLAKAPERAGHMGFARRTMLRLWLDEQRSLRRRMARIARLATSAPRAWLARDATGDAEQRERTERAVAALPPLQRATLVLRLIEELEYAEIAEVLGTSIECVRSNLHLARGRVRELVGDEP